MYKIWVLCLILIYRNHFWKNIFWKCIKGALPTSVEYMDGSSNLCLDFQNRSHLLRNISFVSLPPKNNGKKSYVGVLCRTPFLYWLHNSWRDPIIVGHTRILSHDLKFVPNYRLADWKKFEIKLPLWVQSLFEKGE